MPHTGIILTSSYRSPLLLVPSIIGDALRYAAKRRKYCIIWRLLGCAILGYAFQSALRVFAQDVSLLRAFTVHACCCPHTS